MTADELNKHINRVNAKLAYDYNRFTAISIVKAIC